ncbi:SDR family NAD(P)-dependent oxidoreductase [Streptomyces sp. SID486]|uniref:SDR family NAD(P)-dependent oxidoreductase n=1 Tax=Streptomyces sp. SID486 TaxID=2690264 RepID=UPI0013680BFD|nr:SDR family oxidoreductase [Streptomyces sp. SID486]MYX98244.1 SDR family NAD(P)-dependent oxidoreductase [Streptomyces sp. SID486]
MTTLSYQGTTALITGASSGLGAEFARQWAERGADVVLVARRLDRLAALAAEVGGRYGVTATPVAADLARPGAGAALKEDLDARGIAVHTLINNAGFGSHGAFGEQDPAEISRMIQLNVGAVAELTRAFLPQLAADGRGALVTVASTAAYQPTPAMAVYGATKAFVLSLTEALAYETRASGLRVLAVSPGPVETEFFDVVGTRDAMVGRVAAPADVVDATRRALERRRTPPSVIAGLGNRLSAGAARLAPRRLALSVAGNALKA